MAFPKKSEQAILPKTESLPKQSLFAFTKYDQLNSDQKEKFLKVIRNKQWQFCNKKRQKLHADIFKQKPSVLQDLDKNILNQPIFLLKYDLPTIKVTERPFQNDRHSLESYY